MRGHNFVRAPTSLPWAPRNTRVSSKVQINAALAQRSWSHSLKLFGSSKTMWRCLGSSQYFRGTTNAELPMRGGSHTTVSGTPSSQATQW